MSTTGLLTDYLDLEPLASELDRHPRTIRRWMDQPDGIPHLKLGNRILFRRESVIGWLASKERKPNARRRSHGSA